MLVIPIVFCLISRGRAIHPTGGALSKSNKNLMKSLLIYLPSLKSSDFEQVKIIHIKNILCAKFVSLKQIGFSINSYITWLKFKVLSWALWKWQTNTLLAQLFSYFEQKSIDFHFFAHFSKTLQI